MTDHSLTACSSSTSRKARPRTMSSTLARRALGVSRIGHTGTLDPMATGVLPLVVGRATRLAQFLTAGDKDYDATVAFGRTTDTYDALGKVVTTSAERPTRAQLDAALAQRSAARFEQTPPAYSAKKIDGERSYELARSRKPGATALLPKAVTVTARAARPLSFDGETACLRDARDGRLLRPLAGPRPRRGARHGRGARRAAPDAGPASSASRTRCRWPRSCSRAARRSPAACVPFDGLLAGPAGRDAPEAGARGTGQERTGSGPGRPVAAEPCDPAARPVAHWSRLAGPDGRHASGAGRTRHKVPGFLHAAVVLWCYPERALRRFRVT